MASTTVIGADIANLVNDAGTFTKGPGATALIPVGQNWYQNSGASQQMLTSVPEPASIALMGVALIGLGLTKRRLRPKN